MDIKIERFFESFKHAGRGLYFTFKSEQNFRIQLGATLILAFLAWYFPLSRREIIMLIMLVTMVLTMELLNTALEYFTDLLKPRLHHYVRSIKDIMAGAVLIVSVGAAAVGLIIFVPYFLTLF